MEYKFKTIYKSEIVRECLVDCIPMESENRILWLTSYKEFNALGKLRMQEDGSDLPVLPIFQYTGKKDRDGEEIYNGHILEYKDYKFQICWEEHYLLYSLKILEPVERRTYDYDMKLLVQNHLELSKIIGHEALK